MLTRMTHQTLVVQRAINKFGHSTNSQLVAECRKILPEISATTVHRITSRLIQRGALAYGPEINGSRLVDINIKPHDHFICDGCMGVKDILIPDNLRESIKKQVPGLISGASLTIRGECNSCNK